MSSQPEMPGGAVIGLFLLEAHGKPPRPVREATALPGQGLVGDLHSLGQAGRRRQVLLMEAGDLESLDLKPGDLREQITLRLPGLMDLEAGTRLEVGDATLEISGACEPCTTIGGLLGRADREAFRQALIGRRGMLARVTGVRHAGRIAVGAAVRLLTPDLMQPQAQE